MKKYVLSLFLAIVITISSTAVFAQNKVFTDVDTNHWAYNSINQMVNKGILDGMGDGTFRPSDSVTREQFAKILVLSLNLPLQNPSTPTFADVSKNDWSYQYVEAAKQYLTGYMVDGKLYFRPKNVAVREDMAVAIITAKGMDYQTPDLTLLNSYTDKNLISNNLAGYIAIAVKNKVMEGYGGGIFGAQNTLTRAEACELIYKSSLGANYQGEKVAVKDAKIGTEYRIFNDGNITFQYPMIVEFEKSTKLDYEDGNFKYSRGYIKYNNRMILIDVKYGYGTKQNKTLDEIYNEVNASSYSSNVKKYDNCVIFDQNTKDGIVTELIYLKGIGKGLPVVQINTYENNYITSPNESDQLIINNLVEMIKNSIKVINSEEQNKPTVVSTTPSNSETNVSTKPTIKIIFSEPVKPVSGNFMHAYVREANGNVYGLFGGQCEDYKNANKEQIIKLSHIDVNTLKPNTKYNVEITNHFKNSQGIDSEPYTFSFTTGEAEKYTTIPAVISTNPANGAVNVSVKSAISIKFSEPVANYDSKKIWINDERGLGGNAWRAIGAGGDTLSLWWDELTPSTKYTVNVQKGAFRENEPYTFSFTTAASETTASKVVSTSVADGTTNVDLNPDIKITFSGPIRGVTEWSAPKLYVGNNEWTDGFSMSEWKNDGYVIMNLRNLDPGVKYTVKIENTYTNLAGVIAAPYTFSFTTKAEEGIGNNLCNMTHWAPVVKNGWIYYNDSAGDLCKKKIDGSSKIKIMDGRAAFINVLGGWIYFRDWSGDNGLYKIKTDGTNKTKICNDVPFYILVANDWIFYSNGRVGDTSFYKIKTDGTNRTKIADSGAIINAVDNYVYYSGNNKEDGLSSKGYIYKLNLKDGSYVKIFIGDSRMTFMKGDKEWFYYYTGNSIYKMKLDGTGKTLICNKNVFSASLLNGYIYYIKNYENNDDSYKLFRINTDGTGEIKISNDKLPEFYIFDEFILVNGYKTQKDGTSGVKFIE